MSRQALACFFLARELFISYMASLSEQCVGHSLAGGGTSHKGGRHCQPQLLLVLKGVAPSRPSLGQAHLAPLAQHVLDALGGRW